MEARFKFWDRESKQERTEINLKLTNFGDFKIKFLVFL